MSTSVVMRGLATLRDAAIRHRLALGILLVGIVLHVGKLTAWPSPAGDEMNWFDMAKDAHEGRTPEMAEAASFASTLFARIMSVGFYLGEADWWHARIGVAVLTLVLATGAYALFATSGRRTAGAVMLAWQLLLPWSLAWSRTVSQPYTLMSGLGALGTLVWWHALSQTAPRRRAVLFVVAAQLLAIDLFLSPFAVAPIAAAAVALLVHPRRRDNMRSPWPWVALALIVAETIPVARAASKVAGLEGYTLAQIFSELGPLPALPEGAARRHGRRGHHRALRVGPLSGTGRNDGGLHRGSRPDGGPRGVPLVGRGPQEGTGPGRVVARGRGRVRGIARGHADPPRARA